MKKHILLLAFVLSTVIAFAQEKPTPYTDFIGQQLTAIESNPNWKVLAKTMGYLNHDAKGDVVIVIESKEDFVEIRCSDCSTSLSKARIILVLLNKNDELTVHIQNNEFIPRADEGGMSINIEPEIRIEDNQLIVYQEYTRVHQSYTFEFQKDNFYIVSAKNYSIHSTSGDTYQTLYDFEKMEITIITDNIASQEYEKEDNGEKNKDSEVNKVEREALNKKKTKVIKFDKKPKTLSEFKAMHEWEIIEYHNL